jgi:hypothetical protein
MEHSTEHREGRTMRRRRLRIRRWLVLAATLVTLGIAASASAMPGGHGNGGKALYPQAAAATDAGASSSIWWYVVIAAAVVFGLTIAGAALIRNAENRRRVAGLAH